MTKLTDTQRVILSAASQRTNRMALPLPKRLRGEAAHKVVGALIEKGLLRPVKANRKLNDLVWRNSDDGHGLTLIITEAGLAAIGIELEAQKPKMSKPKPEPRPASTEHKPRGSTKQSLLIDLLKRPGGITLAEIVEATGWQPHTVRGAMAGALKKKLGLTIDSAKNKARGRVYRLA